MKSNGFQWFVPLLLVCGAVAAMRSAHADSKAQPARLIATDYPSLQAAVDALPGRRGEVYLPAGVYTLNKTLDLSQKGDNGGGTVLSGAGQATVIRGATSGTPVIDMTGASSCLIQNLTIDSPNSADVAANVDVLLARNGAGSAQENRFNNVIFSGYCTVANVYNLSSELDRFNECTFTNWAPGSDNLVFCQENYAGIKSPSIGTITGNSTTELRVEGCIFYGYGPDGPAQTGIHELLKGGANVRIEGLASDVTVRDSYMDPPAGGYGVWLGRASWGAEPQGICLENLRIEGDQGAHSPQSIVKCAGWLLPGAKAPWAAVDGKPVALSAQSSDIVIRDCTIYSGPKTVALDTGYAHYWNVEGNVFFSHPGQLIVNFDGLLYCRFQLNRFNWGGNEDISQPKNAVALQGGTITGSDIAVPSRNQVVATKITGTVIDALGEDGGRKLYMSDVHQQNP